MSVSINGTNGLTFNDGSSQATAATGFGFKNRIINGDMRIDQRNNGASGTASAVTVDRWQYYGSQASKFTWGQNLGGVTPPSGFTNYLGFTSSSAYNVGASEGFIVYQKIEGYNVADLNFGKSTAQTLTVSFWVRSSLTGTFGGALVNGADDRSYPFSYTINSANTWEQKTVTLTADTSGAWLTNNGTGLGIAFSLGTGSSKNNTAWAWVSGLYWGTTGCQSVVGTNGATFYITGVQLEKGSTATAFDYRPYGTELMLCQRYYEWIQAAPISGANITGTFYAPVFYKVTKRATPTITYDSISGALTDIGVEMCTMYRTNATPQVTNPRISAEL